MSKLELKPNHKPIQNYYAALRQFDDLGVSHEGAVNSNTAGQTAKYAKHAKGKEVEPRTIRLWVNRPASPFRSAFA